MNNPNFKGVEFDPLLSEAEANAFTMSPSRWIETTNSIGIVVKNGKNGGTFAQKDIAFKFASWVSTEFELYLIREFQRLKAAEWRTANPTLPGNVRDYATVNQLICLSNMESLNSVLINEGVTQSERLTKLNQIAISQMTVLESIGQNKLLK